jgi:Ca2+-binding EF-hand superfamily protein
LKLKLSQKCSAH